MRAGVVVNDLEADEPISPLQANEPAAAPHLVAETSNLDSVERPEDCSAAPEVELAEPKTLK